MFDESNPLFTKMSKLDNASSYTSEWEESFNSETKKMGALSSGQIADSPFELKLYTDKKGGILNPFALGLSRVDKVEHAVEAAFEWLEYKLIKGASEKYGHDPAKMDDSLIDMHYDNAKEYLQRKM